MSAFAFLSGTGEIALFLERAARRFSGDEATLEQLAAEFGRRFPGDAEGFPYDFALRLEQAGIPPRFITDLEVQCVKDDLEALVNDFRKSYVFGGVIRGDYYALLDVLRQLPDAEYAGELDEAHARLKREATAFIASQPDQGEVDAFFSLYEGVYRSGELDPRAMFSEFRKHFPGNTVSRELFEYELWDVLRKEKPSPRQLLAAREEARITEQLQERNAFWVIRYFSLKPQYIPDILIAMYPDLAHNKDELRSIFSSMIPETADARGLRYFLGVCRKPRFDAMHAYDGRRDALNALSAIATKIFERSRHAEEMVTSILKDVVVQDYRQLFAQQPSAVVPELEKAVAEASHPYVQMVLSSVMDYYQRLSNVKLVGVRPRIWVK